MKSTLRLTVLSIAIAILAAAGARHEFHVSITDIHDEGDTVKVALKLFIHDLEDQIKMENGAAVFLDQSTEPERQFRHIKNYVAPRFELLDAAKPIRMEWVGHELEDDVCWVYGYALTKPELKILFVRNAVMFEHDEDQHNMIHYHRGETTTSKVCSPRQPEVRFSRG